MQQTPTTQGAAFRPPLLDLKRIAALTDAAMHLFSALYDAERQAKQAAKTRLRAALDSVELCSPHEHYADDEEHAPSDEAE
jgi:hypothetical protein